MKIDLHIHTTNSDGAFTPTQIIDMAYQNGVKYLAIADHDTIESYNSELFEYAKRKDFRI